MPRPVPIRDRSGPLIVRRRPHWGGLIGLTPARFGPLYCSSTPFLPTSSTGGTRPPERKVATMKGYVVQEGSRFYAVIYAGVDPMTGRG